MTSRAEITTSIDRPRDRRHPGGAAHARQGQDRAALPGHHPDVGEGGRVSHPW